MLRQTHTSHNRQQRDQATPTRLQEALGDTSPHNLCVQPQLPRLRWVVCIRPQRPLEHHLETSISHLRWRRRRKLRT